MNTESDRCAGSATGLLRPPPRRSAPFVENTPESPSFARVASCGTAANRRPSVEGSLPLPSKVSIKKPCQYFDRSCKTADTPTATLTGFGKAPADVNAIRSRKLSPIGKLVFLRLGDQGLRDGPHGLDERRRRSGSVAVKQAVLRSSNAAPEDFPADRQVHIRMMPGM